MNIRLAALSWKTVTIVMAMMAFSAFVLWLTASHFDASELKSVLMLSVGFVMREILPAIVNVLKHSKEAESIGMDTDHDLP